MSLLPPAKVGKLQEALHAKAKKAPTCRFDAPYDKMYRRDVLVHAYRCGRANDGTAGVDGQTFDDMWSRYADRHLYEQLGLLRLRRLPRPTSS